MKSSNEIEEMGDVRRVQIFCSTWNMGDIKSVEQIGDLRRWLPADGGYYDVLVVGFQENQIANDLMLAIHSHLGKVIG